MQSLGNRRTNNRGEVVMAGAPPKKKVVREEKNSEEIAFASAKHSEYNTCTPMANAEFIKMTHPFTRKDLHFNTKSREFYETFKDWSDKGLGDRLFLELTQFGANIDERWFDVLHEAKSYCGVEIVQ